MVVLELVPGVVLELVPGVVDEVVGATLVVEDEEVGATLVVVEEEVGAMLVVDEDVGAMLVVDEEEVGAAVVDEEELVGAAVVEEEEVGAGVVVVEEEEVAMGVVVVEEVAVVVEDVVVGGKLVVEEVVGAGVEVVVDEVVVGARVVVEEDVGAAVVVVVEEDVVGAAVVVVDEVVTKGHISQTVLLSISRGSMQSTLKIWRRDMSGRKVFSLTVKSSTFDAPAKGLLCLIVTSRNSGVSVTKGSLPSGTFNRVVPIVSILNSLVPRDSDEMNVSTAPDSDSGFFTSKKKLWSSPALKSVATVTTIVPVSCVHTPYGSNVPSMVEFTGKAWSSLVWVPVSPEIVNVSPASTSALARTVTVMKLHAEMSGYRWLMVALR
eukprot:3932279-Rhodomonas_salina.1